MYSQKGGINMRATGIVRRIDDLGRVVIPKEIRRTQSIRVGDPLEIFVTGSGEVVFKKYSPVGEMYQEAALLCEVLAKTSHVQVIATDRDRVIAQSGAKELMDQPLGALYEKAMSERRFYLRGEKDGNLALQSQPISAMMPVLARGDLVGSVAIIGEKAVPEQQQTLIKVAASYLGKRLEE